MAQYSVHRPRATDPGADSELMNFAASLGDHLDNLGSSGEDADNHREFFRSLRVMSSTGASTETEDEGPLGVQG